MGDTGEKTEEASPEKLRKAKEEGQVPKSQDLVGALAELGRRYVREVRVPQGQEPVRVQLPFAWKDPQTARSSDTLERLLRGFGGVDAD